MRFRERKEIGKVYKREGGEGRKGSTISVTLRCRNSDLTDLLVGVVARPCEVRWELDVPSG